MHSLLGFLSTTPGCNPAQELLVPSIAVVGEELFDQSDRSLKLVHLLAEPQLILAL
jgi:hypothetical protein